MFLGHVVIIQSNGGSRWGKKVKEALT